MGRQAKRAKGTNREPKPQYWAPVQAPQVTTSRELDARLMSLVIDQEAEAEAGLYLTDRDPTAGVVAVSWCNGEYSLCGHVRTEADIKVLRDVIEDWLYENSQADIPE